MLEIFIFWCQKLGDDVILVQCPFNNKTDKEGDRRTFLLAVFLDVLAKPLQCFGNCQCCALEMGKKFNSSLKPVRKKLKQFEEYVPLRLHHSTTYTLRFSWDRLHICKNVNKKHVNVYKFQPMVKRRHVQPIFS